MELVAINTILHDGATIEAGKTFRVNDKKIAERLIKVGAATTPNKIKELKISQTELKELLERCYNTGYLLVLHDGSLTLKSYGKNAAFAMRFDVPETSKDGMTKELLNELIEEVKKLMVATAINHGYKITFVE